MYFCVNVYYRGGKSNKSLIYWYVLDIPRVRKRSRLSLHRTTAHPIKTTVIGGDF